MVFRGDLGINSNHVTLRTELLRGLLAAMSEINPYAPTNSARIDESPSRGRKVGCPLCSHPISRSLFLTSGRSVVCPSCRARIALSMPWYFPLILLHTILILAASIWIFSEFTGYNAKPFFLFIPLIVIMVSQWMQWTYGKVTVKRGRIVDDE